MAILSNYQEKYSKLFLSILINSVDSLFKDGQSELREIFSYHLGLEDDPEKQGKRIRPLLMLLCTEGTGGNWEDAVPGAVAIELTHNFSLIHDDIEDNGLFRHSKDTVWVKWGLAKGLNAGDAMFASAFEMINKMKGKISSEIINDAYSLLSLTCLKLTSGQHLDIDFENRMDVSLQEYDEMISGKTAALLACCTQMGALLSGFDEKNQLLYARFGHDLGMAFQMYDDWLGIWGDPKITGKPAFSDLLEGKKSLPVLLGLQQSSKFLDQWTGQFLSQKEARVMSAILKDDGVEELVRIEFNKWNQKALESLNSLNCNEKIRTALDELTNKLLMREK